MSTADTLLILAYIIEPAIWVYSMYLRFEEKYKKKAICVGYIILDATVSCLDEFTDVSKVTGELFFTLLLFGYATAFICLAFKGKTTKKILHIGILFLVSLACDFIVLVCFYICGVNIQMLSESGIYNAAATITSKIVMLLIINIVFKKIEPDKIFMPIVYLIIILELPSVTLFKTERENGMFLIMYVISQIAAGFIIAYIRWIFRQKKREAEKIIARAEESEARTAELETKAAELEARAIELETNGTEIKEEDAQSSIEIIENRKRIKLNIHEVIYAERVKRKILVVTEKKKYEINGSIADLEQKFGNEFIKVNQGTLVCTTYIEKVDGEFLQLSSGETFHIARGQSKKVKEAIE